MIFFRNFSAPGFAAVLVVDFAVGMVGVRQLNQARAGGEKTVLPAFQAKSGNGRRHEAVRPGLRRSGRGGRAQIQQHEMAWVEPKALAHERRPQIEAEGNQLRLDAFQAGQLPQDLQRVIEQFLRDAQLRPARGNEQAAQQRLVLFENIEGVSRCLAALHGHSPGQGLGIHELLDEFQRAAIVPMQLFAPPLRLFLEERSDLPRIRLSQIHNRHDRFLPVSCRVPPERFMITRPPVQRDSTT